MDENRPLLSLPVLLIYGVVFAAQCSRTMFVVIVSWFALSIEGRVASVGQLLVWWPLLSLFLGPIMGVAVDHFNRRNLLIVGEGIRIAGVMWLALKIQAGSVDLITLRETAIIVYFGALISIPSSQGLLQVVGGHSLARISTGAVSVNLAAEVVGAGAVGVALATVGTLGSLMICITFSVIAVAFVTKFHHAGAVPPRRTGATHLTDLIEGFRIVIYDRQLSMTCLALTFGWAAAQITLALLAGFTRFELRLGPDAYGWIDSMWGVGGVVGGIALLYFSRTAINVKFMRLSLPLLAAATAGFSLAQSFWAALLLQALMGVAFAINLAVCDAHILNAVDASAIGRVRNNLQAAAGAVGVLVFLSPSLYGDASIRAVYFGFSIILASVAAILVIGNHDGQSGGWDR
ncbi:MFS transporter [Sinorhizobium meliloti]|uniref:MFS transporter n=1 Tax=Rhizobium meliloti TaxID=382 RepID=UPI00036981DC|nr:MFS transporter [Sinorhizobium meliloti]MDE3878728.1 MFS transporter [Sinorhizobium meliloti]MDE4604589.1 MFS transporter [Sinorhizobium meliloti]MDX0315687.1 hypothetical protein [Sinorhizobium meliloti]RVH06070.1 hypothetical protein CN216_31430 [Sinorhizobium meliloti]UDU21150.1 MFS transporter [Sinorhizobium meliloti]